VVIVMPGIAQPSSSLVSVLVVATPCPSNSSDDISWIE
jgi:hypothetical protein